MVTYYRRPGVYLEESLLLNPADVAGTTTVAAFVGVAPKGPVNTPVLCESWNSYSQTFGGFDLIGPTASIATKVLTYLPYSVYSFYQNGGRFAWIVRSVPVDPATNGTPSSQTVAGTNPDETGPAFVIRANSPGEWGNDLSFIIRETVRVTEPGEPAKDVFTLSVLLKNSQGQDEVIESYSGLSMTGDVPGTKRVDVAINDPNTGAGSRYVRITDVNDEHTELANPDPPESGNTPIPLLGGVDPDVPNESELASSALELAQVEGPMNLNIAGYLEDANTMDTSDAPANWRSGIVSPRSDFPDREDIIYFNDGCPPRDPVFSPASYTNVMMNNLQDGAGDSYTASYGPWIMIPNPAPKRVGEVIAVPPGGAILGTIARLDATVGVHRAPAGIIAGIANAVGVQCKFTDTQLGDLNQSNINVIRPVIGAGMCIMGARTRKGYGPDKYLSGRRTLIAIKESLRRSTQYAIFENNDERLWSSLRITADSILRPVWERGGLRGVNQQQAYYVRCDATLNTPQVIASGTVLMEVGVALEYPAEFVIIKITQVNSADFVTDITTNF